MIRHGGSDRAPSRSTNHPCTDLQRAAHLFTVLLTHRSAWSKEELLERRGAGKERSQVLFEDGRRAIGKHHKLHQLALLRL